jgi:very-short-patch-repair endonuclease
MNKIFNQNKQKEKRRALRKRSAKAERMMWQNLRNRGFEGFKVRRQFSVGFFVLDFYCPELKLRHQKTPCLYPQSCLNFTRNSHYTHIL